MDFTVRLLTPIDAELLEAYLEPHTPFAYFMRSNVKRGGFLFQGKPYQAHYFGAFDNQALVGVLAHSWLGSVQIFVTHDEAISSLATAWKNHLDHSPQEIGCFLGPDLQVRTLLTALRISTEKMRDGGTKEWLFTIDLVELRSPLIDANMYVRHAELKDRDLLTRWRHDFYVEAIGDAPGDDTLKKSTDEITRRIDERDLFVLEGPQGLLSFCGAGGFLADWKMIGPVWTPVRQRNHGYARAVTAGALEILKKEGAHYAVLFAHKPAAEKAYRAIGFDRVGDWRLDFLKMPVRQIETLV